MASSFRPTPETEHVENSGRDPLEELPPGIGIGQVLRDVCGQSHAEAVELSTEFFEGRPVKVPDDRRGLIDDRTTRSEHPNEGVEILSPTSGRPRATRAAWTVRMSISRRACTPSDRWVRGS